MEITYEQYKGIIDKSFIAPFDLEKHKPKDYKLILILGDDIINGTNQDGNCLFIPFDDWYEDLQKGDNQDGNTDWYYHYNYLVRALASSKYEFPDNYCLIIDTAKKNIQSRKGPWSDLFIDLAFQGVCVLSNYTYNNVNNDQNLNYGIYSSAKPSEKQLKTLIKIQESIEQNSENKIEDINQFFLCAPINVKERVINIKNKIELGDLERSIKAKKILNCTKREQGDQYIFSYLLKQGDFICKKLDDFYKQFNIEGRY